MPRTDDDAPRGDRPSKSADADSTDLVKRLKDNQPLSDTEEVRDEDPGPNRQYGVRASDPDRDERDD